MKYREITKKLKRLGCELTDIKSGSHRIWFNPSNGHEAAIPDWRGKDLATGTLRSCIKQLGIDWQTFLKA